MIEYPPDYEKSDAYRPICGVLALATITDQKISTIYDYFKDVIYSGRIGFDGATLPFHYIMVANKFGTNLKKLNLKRKYKLHFWIIHYAKPETKYLITTHHHAFVYCDGFIMDQSSRKKYDAHLYGKRTIEYIWEVE
ncbi:MAG: hypothetical protein COA52_01005 [Hyphomicrobiales bacterium]|nr:MAG: hypothetical protein COA52_01005 [Hyphomicrobiales bacterium]